MKKMALIVSTGVQDLKVVCTEERDGNTRIVLRSVDRERRRDLHERLLNDNPPWWRIVATEEELKQALPESMKHLKIPFLEKEGGSNDQFQDKYIKAARPGNNLPFEVDCYKGTVVKAVTDGNGHYLLFPAKLYTVVAGLKAQDFAIDAALVFYTDRIYRQDFDKEYKEEPIATGKLIAQWLADGNGLNPDEGANFKSHPFCYVNYLKDEVALEGDRVALEGEFSPYDQPLALSAIAHIDSAVKNLADNYSDCTAVVSHTGGPGDVKAPLTASARLHFGGRIIEIHDNKYAPFKPEYLSSTRYRIPPRNAALEARHQAAMRLWEGDFAGAWAVASFIQRNDPDSPCDSWVARVREAANFMQGWRGHDPRIIDPFKGIPEGVKKLLLLAWRVEAALQHDQGEPLITDALRQMATFREKALEYLVLRVLQKDKNFRGTVCLSSWRPYPEHSNKTLVENIKIKDGYLDTRNLNNIESYLNMNGDEDEKKQYRELRSKIMEKDCDRNIKKSSLHEYRNKLTHNTLTESEVQIVRECAQANDLWSLRCNNQKSDNLGTCFLEQQVVKDLFNVIAPNLDAAEAYRDFVTTLINAIRTPIKPDCPG